MNEITINDPVFGTIVFDGLWEAQEMVLFLGHELLVSIGDDAGSEPDDHQRERYHQFLSRRDTLKAELQQAIFDYYQTVCGSYRDATDEEEWDDYVPVLTLPDEIWALIEPTSIHVPMQTPDTLDSLGFDFCMEWKTTWDEEHGLQTGYQDWGISVVQLPQY